MKPLKSMTPFKLIAALALFATSTQSMAYSVSILRFSASFDPGNSVASSILRIRVVGISFKKLAKAMDPQMWRETFPAFTCSELLTSSAAPGSNYTGTLREVVKVEASLDRSTIENLLNINAETRTLRGRKKPQRIVKYDLLRSVSIRTSINSWGLGLWWTPEISFGGRMNRNDGHVKLTPTPGANALDDYIIEVTKNVQFSMPFYGSDFPTSLAANRLKDWMETGLLAALSNLRIR